MPAPNPIDVVERAYDLEADPRQWLETVARTVYPLLDGGCGLFAYYYDFSLAPAAWFTTAVALDMGEEVVQESLDVVTRWSSDVIERMHDVPTALAAIGEACKAVGIADLRQSPVFGSYLGGMNARDMVSLRTVETGGRGIALCAPQREDRAFERRTKSLWAKVAAHLAAGRRLRERFGTDPFEAVLTPSGQVEHAEGETTSRTTRETLRDAVLRQERARGKLRREDPEGATEMWTALVSGRWSLVDHFETDGRRYIVARRNEHGSTDPRALGEREHAVAQLAALGKSNKLIAYELGISESTVGTHLSSAMRKLRVKTRIELLRMLMHMPSV
jgi:DNA-binding CsgD family transcriptional regulator